MTRMTEQEIEAAIETLRSSYSYDPPARWEKAHAALKVEGKLMEPEVRPYVWIRWAIVTADLVAALAIFILCIRALFASSSSSTWWIWLAIMGVPTGLIPLYAERAQLYFASRRHPTARFKADIDRLVSAFDQRLDQFTQKATT